MKERKKEMVSKKLEELKAGQVFEVNGIKFVVLNQEDNKTAIIAADVLEDRVFDEDTPDWKKSEIRKYLNTEVLNEYEQLFGAENILEEETDLTTLDGLDDYGTCKDKIRMLTFEERRKYQKLYEHSGTWEWTVTPWSVPERGWEYSICCVSSGGLILNSFCYYCYAVRPFCILKSNILVSVEE